MSNMDILQKKWFKKIIPVWNRGSNILVRLIWSHHRLLCFMTNMKEHSREICYNLLDLAIHPSLNLLHPLVCSYPSCEGSEAGRSRPPDPAKYLFLSLNSHSTPLQISHCRNFFLPNALNFLELKLFSVHWIGSHCAPLALWHCAHACYDVWHNNLRVPNAKPNCSKVLKC